MSEANFDKKWAAFEAEIAQDKDIYAHALAARIGVSQANAVLMLHIGANFCEPEGCYKLKRAMMCLACDCEAFRLPEHKKIYTPPELCPCCEEPWGSGGGSFLVLEYQFSSEDKSDG